MVKLIYHGYNRNYSRLLEYIYDKHTDKIDNIIYTNECNANRFNYHLRRYKDKESIKTVLPYDCDITFTECIDEEGIEFQCILKTNTDNASAFPIREFNLGSKLFILFSFSALKSDSVINII